MSKVAILLAAYNGERFIDEQLKSIISQTIKPKNIFICIDKSDDDTLKIVKKYMLLNPTIKLLSYSRKFGSAASNFLYLFKTVDLKNYDFIALSDQDDIWSPVKLERAINHLKNGYFGYSSNVLAFWDNGSRKVIKKNQSQKKYDFYFESPGPGCTFVVNNALACSFKNFLMKNKLLFNNHYHDWLLYAYARSHGFKWFIDDFISLHYRQHDRNELGVNIGFNAAWKRVRKVLRGEGFNYSFYLMSKFNGDNYISSLSPKSRFIFLKLAMIAYKCRRRRRDQFYFFVACIILFLIFPKVYYFDR